MAERDDVAHAEHGAIAHSHSSRYFVVWIALVILTIATYSLSRLHLPGALGLGVALLIAVSKGSLVALFFMHLWDQRGANRLVFVTSLVFVALLVGLVLSDSATRFPLANPPGTPGALPLGATDYAAGPPVPAPTARHR